MPPSLDLYLLPLLRQNGQDQPYFPGLYAVTPPRRPARGRSADNLVLYLTLVGNALFPPEHQNQMLVRMAQIYYKTPRTVTAGLRAAAEWLNQFLLDRNVRSTRNGRQGIGVLTMGVLREDNLYLAHCGPAHAFVITPQETRQLSDLAASGRGLGLSRTTPIRFFQTSLESHPFLLLSHLPSENWNTTTLHTSPKQGLESLRRLLLAQAGSEFNAVLVHAQTGSGRLRLLRSKAAFQDMAHPPAKEEEEHSQPPTTPGEAAPTLVLPEPPPLVQPEEEAKPVDRQPPQAEQETPPQAEETPPPEQTGLPEAGGEAQAPETPGAASSRGIYRNIPGADQKASRATPIRRRAQPIRLPSIRRSLAKIPAAPWLGSLAKRGRAAGSKTGYLAGRALVWLARGVKTISGKILPDESLVQVPASTMVFFAVAIPIVISVIGALVFLERGHAKQHQVYYEQAAQAAQQATLKTESVELRAAWSGALALLEKAEAYKVTDESRELRSAARGALDELDAIERLDFRPAFIRELPRTIQVVRMVANVNELYLLDSLQGNVLRGVLTGSGFEIDPNFLCGPTPGPTSVGPLIDIAALPRGSQQGATVIGMDENANLLLCIPGSQPLITQLVPPNINFGAPKGFTLDASDLYVLDPQTNAVWIYRTMEFTLQPRLFFDEQIPSMINVIDLAVNNDDLYLLHSDGHQTMCVYSGYRESPTRCEDPLTYTDTRPGRSSGPVIPDSLFNQIYFSPPPDPSIFMLDPNNQAIFHFSLRLTFQRQFRSAIELPQGPATSFAISPNRLAFLAIGNQVFYAALP